MVVVHRVATLVHPQAKAMERLLLFQVVLRHLLMELLMEDLHLARPVLEVFLL